MNARGGSPRRAIGYARVSTLDQQQHGLSLEAQRRRLVECAVVYGYDLIEIVTECASGGIDPKKRAGLSSVLAALRTKRADCVVVAKLDRVSRRTLDALQLIDQAERERWQVVSLSEQLDTGTPAGKFTTTLLAAVAELERATIRERTRAGMAQVRAEGRARSRFVPFGFRVEGRPDMTTVVAGDRARLVPFGPEQLVLQELLCLRADGKGARTIAATMNGRGVVNPRSGRPWSVGGVATILKTALRPD